MKSGAVAVALAILLTAPAVLQAGRLVNRDSRDYEYIIHWEDLSPASHGNIGPKEEAVFHDGKGILELLGTPDNIYIRGQEVVTIKNSVMNKEPETKQ